MKHLLLPLLLLSCCLPVAADELYRWVDADGKVHFGDRPPEGSKAEPLTAKLKPINRADGGTQQPTGAPVRANDIEREYQQRKRREQQQQLQKQQAACNRARKALAVLKGPVYFVDAQGNETSISEREREARARALEAQIRQQCG